MSETLDSPEKQVSLTSSAPQDSPFADFVNALSPIKPTKTVHAHTFQDIYFAPPGHLSAVFSSPPHHRRRQLPSKRNNRQPNAPRGENESNSLAEIANQGTKRFSESGPSNHTTSTNHPDKERGIATCDKNQDKKIRLQTQSFASENSHGVIHSEAIHSRWSNVGPNIHAHSPDDKESGPPVSLLPSKSVLSYKSPSENLVPSLKPNQPLKGDKTELTVTQSSESSIHLLCGSEGQESLSQDPNSTLPPPSIPPSQNQDVLVQSTPPTLPISDNPSLDKDKETNLHQDGLTSSQYASLVTVLHGRESHEDKSLYTVPSSSPMTPKPYGLASLSPIPALKLDNGSTDTPNELASKAQPIGDPPLAGPPLDADQGGVDHSGAEEGTPPPVLSQASNNEAWNEVGERGNVSQVSFDEDSLERDEMYAIITTPVNIPYDNHSLFTPEIRRIKMDGSASVDSLTPSDAIHLPPVKFNRQNRKTARAIAFVSNMSAAKDPDTVEKSEVTTQHVLVPSYRMASENDMAQLRSDDTSVQDMEMKWQVSSANDASMRFSQNPSCTPHSFDSLNSPSSFPSHSASMNSSFSNPSFSASPLIPNSSTPGGEGIPLFHSHSVAEEQHSVWKSGYVSSSRTKGSEDMDMPNVKLNFSDLDSPGPLDPQKSPLVYKLPMELVPLTILRHPPASSSPLPTSDLVGYSMQENPLVLESPYPQTSRYLSKRMNLDENSFQNMQSPSSLLASEGSPQDSTGLSKKKRKAKDSGEGCKKCNCKKSRCLKLYCECFRSGVYCTGPCRCDDCQNIEEYADLVREIRTAISSRNPLAFAPKIINSKTSSPGPLSELHDTFPSSARHKSGCNCKKSMCTKKYCECYQAGVGCMTGCRCENCMNPFGRSFSRLGNEEGSEPSHEEQAHSQDTSRSKSVLKLETNFASEDQLNESEESTPRTKETKTPEPQLMKSLSIKNISSPTSSDHGVQTFPARISFHSSTSSTNPSHSSNSAVSLDSNSKSKQLDVPFIRPLPAFPSNSTSTPIQPTSQAIHPRQTQSWMNSPQQGRVLHVIGGELNQSYSYPNSDVQSLKLNPSQVSKTNVTLSAGSLPSTPSSLLRTNMSADVHESLQYQLTPQHPPPNLTTAPSLDLLHPDPFSPPLSSVCSPTVQFSTRIPRMDSTHPSFSYPTPSFAILSPLNSLHHNLNFVHRVLSQKEKVKLESDNDLENDESDIQNFLVFPACEEEEEGQRGEDQNEAVEMDENDEMGGIDETGDGDPSVDEDDTPEDRNDVKIENESENDASKGEIERGRFAMNMPKTKSLSPNKKRISPPPGRNNTVKDEEDIFCDDFVLPSHKSYAKHPSPFSTECNPNKTPESGKSNPLTHGYIS